MRTFHLIHHLQNEFFKANMRSASPLKIPDVSSMSGVTSKEIKQALRPLVLCRADSMSLPKVAGTEDSLGKTDCPGRVNEMIASVPAP